MKRYWRGRGSASSVSFDSHFASARWRPELPPRQRFQTGTGFDLKPEVQAATLKFYLDLRDGYIGSPMLSALYGVWAAYAGDRALSAELMEDGYGRFCVGRFMQTLEYRQDVFSEQPRAGPFFANLGGFLLGLLTGFPGLQPGWGDSQGWARRAVTLPEGWTAVEAERIWIGGRPYRLVARQGAERAELTAL